MSIENNIDIEVECYMILLQLRIKLQTFSLKIMHVFTQIQWKKCHFTVVFENVPWLEKNSIVCDKFGCSVFFFSFFYEFEKKNCGKK